MIKVVLWTAGLKAKFIEERGAGLAEYALLLFVIAVAIAGVVGTFGGTIGDLFQNASDNIPATTVAGG